MEKLRLLDLFSGIGGFSLGLERTGGFETVAFCEIEPFPRKVLAKHWPNVPCFKDVRKLTRQDIDGPIDVICGGYPCQPFSTAGQRLGKEDDRHLWPEVNRLLDEFRPTWFIGENVAGHISMGLDDVLSDLEDKGYAARTFVIPACAVDAKHRRDRVWIVANIVSHTDKGQQPRFTGIQTDRRGECLDGAPDESLPEEQRTMGQSTDTVANSQRIRCGQVEPPEFGRTPSEGAASPFEHSSFAAGWARWEPEPAVCRVAHGVPNRVDRLKALGNAVVPQIPEMLGYAILDAIASNN